MHYAIEKFTDRRLGVELVQQLIDRPANSMTLQYDAYASMRLRLAFGIEARSVDNKVDIMKPVPRSWLLIVRRTIVEILFPKGSTGQNPTKRCPQRRRLSRIRTGNRWQQHRIT